MHPTVVPRIRIYLRQLQSKSEDFNDILTAGHLTWSDLELDARANLDKVNQLRYLDERAKNAD